MAAFQDERRFARNIEDLSKRSCQSHTYPRPDLANISNYLNEVNSYALKRGQTGSSPRKTESFVVVNKLANPHNQNLQFEASATGLEDFAALDPASSGPSLLFLRGFASSQWLNTIGDTYHVSPELFRRHLAFQAFTSGTRDLHSLPPLPSSSGRIFQLTIRTICCRNLGALGYEPEDLEMSRSNNAAAMNTYFQQLRNRADVADSVVRRCLLLSKQEYVLEQTITVEVGPPGDNWRIIVWLDNGRDLAQSVPGPWNPLPGTRPWETYFLPIIVDHGSAPFGTSDTLPLAHHFSVPGDFTPQHGEEWKAAQNICHLPFQYGENLDDELASQDALYALSELLHFSASATVQYLNFLGQKMHHELSFIGRRDIIQSNSASLLNLKYIKTLLASQSRDLLEIIGILRSRHSLDWPRLDGVSTTEKRALLLLADFEHLLERSETLARECERGMSTLADSSVLEEARRSAELAMTVGKLTMIGTIFIPLSFVCAVWGTNFEELGSGSQPIWMLFATSVPVLLLVFAMYRWESLKQWRRKAMGRHGEVGRKLS